MKNIKFNTKQVLTIVTVLFVLGGFHSNNAQRIKWLHVTELQSPISETGAETEGQFPSLQHTNHFSWPAQYGLEQTLMRAHGFWIGCKNFNDPVEGALKTVKVIGVGPRAVNDRVNQIFPVELKLIAKRRHPAVVVDNNNATTNDTYDNPDEIDPNLPCDRMVVVKFHTSMGVTVTKKVMVFDSPNHSSYYIHDYTFTNTGIYNATGDVKPQTLQDVYFYWNYRWAFAGESTSGWGSTWGAFSSAWGSSTLTHDFGGNPGAPQFNDPTSPFYQLRGYYTYYGPQTDRSVTYNEDWGCPNEDEDGRLGQVQFGGCVTLHADKTATNKTDDLYQPKTTWFIGADIDAMSSNASQYDEAFMNDRYTIMSEGHPEIPHDEVVGDGNYPGNYSDPRRNSGGGVSQGQGYGPYTLVQGDSVHIVFAIGVAGISREKNLEVGKNWIQWYKNTGQPLLVRPNGEVTADHNLYKKEWFFTGKDSLLKLFRNALNNYKSNYTLPMAPPPPDQFVVSSGGNKIQLTWSDNAESSPHFGGYIVYRSVGNVLDPLTHYEKIWECDKSNLTNTYEDRTPHRGFDYYYAVQSKDDGTVNDVKPGVPLYSNLVWTITSVSATLQREAIPDTPLPFDFTTFKWKQIIPKGEWKADSTYHNSENSSDAVTYSGSTYVCIIDEATNISIMDSIGAWKSISYTGPWVSGKEYKAYSSVTVNGLEYYTPFSISGGQGLELVRVVPNPYDKRSRLFQFGEDSQYDRLAFYGLPAECKLMIFTERGDLIWEKEHTSGTGDELWDSKTSSGQIVGSGIYVLYVETPKKESVIRKFVIIR